VRNLIDCHVHTALCGHARGTAEECVAAGATVGLQTIAITEHLALPDDIDPHRHLSMPAGALPGYLDEVAAARAAHPEIDVVCGVEADFLPERLDEISAEIERARAYPAPATLVLGSVHFIGDWAFDDPHHLSQWDGRDILAAWESYFALWCEAVACGIFDVMAHPDLIKKFGHRPDADLSAIYSDAAAVAADVGVVIEVSSAGLRKPVGEIYPGPELLAEFARAGVKATVGSDAHAPAEVGAGIPDAYAALRAAGYTSLWRPLSGGGWKESEL
jgi:histidinol-phosphatase (PHP family)